MAKAATIDTLDCQLLALGHWQSLATDRRAVRLARLRLCESIANETRTDPATGLPLRWTHWRTTEKGRLLLRARRVVL